ncbi:MAG: helix-turn-helix transcriptional regulator [Bacteroidota bacterium]
MLVIEELEMERLNRIKVLLAEKNIKQIDLAVAIGKSANTVASFCNNKSQPRVDDLKKIADYLDVDIRELLVSTKED